MLTDGSEENLKMTFSLLGQIAMCINREKIFAAVNEDRRSGKLSRMIRKNSPFVYEVNPTVNGLIDRVFPNGDRETGNFENGQFIPLHENK